MKFSHAVERKWNLRNIQANETEMRDGELGGDEDQ